MQFCPDSKLVGTLSNNSLLKHLDYVGLIRFFFFQSSTKCLKEPHNKFTSWRPGKKKNTHKKTLGVNTGPLPIK